MKHVRVAYVSPHQDLAEFCGCGRPIGLVIDPEGNAWRACASRWTAIETNSAVRAEESLSGTEDE